MMAVKKKKRSKPKSRILELARDPMFRKRVEKAKKGKGSYARKAKHNKRDGYDLIQLIVSYIKS